MTRKGRIHTLDEIRGFCVFCMVFDHCLFTYGYMFGSELSKSLFDFFTCISPAFAAAFVIICGISCRLSHNNLLRGLKILGAALAVTLVSLAVMPEAPIIFGILHLLGVSVLLYALVGRFTDRIPVAVGVAACVVLFVLTYSVGNGYLGVGPFRVNLPQELYKSNGLMAFGLVSPAVSYSDYFPLLPWVFAFFAGTFIGKYAQEDRFPKCMYKQRIPFLSVLGANAFFAYLIHQPLAYGVFYLVSLIGGNTT